MFKRMILIGGIGLLGCMVLLGVFYLGIPSKLFAQGVSQQDLADAQAVYDDAMNLEKDNDYQQAAETYKKIISQYPRTIYAQKAVLWLKKLDILESLLARDNISSVNKANKMIKDYTSSPDLPYVLCEVARLFRQSRLYPQAASICDYVIKTYPASDAAMGAYEELTVVHAQRSNDVNAFSTFNNLLKKFSSHKNLSACINRIARQAYYYKGLNLERKELNKQAENYFKKAIDVWEVITKNFAERDPNITAETYCYLGECYNKVGEYQKSINCYQMVAGNYPAYPLAWHAKFMVGRNYESMKKAGLLTAQQSDPNIALAYQQVLEIDPNCKASGIARRWLDNHNNQ